MSKTKRRRKDARKHRFVRKIEAMMGAGQIPANARVVHADHDAWCPRLRGGVCRCEPDVYITGWYTHPGANRN